MSIRLIAICILVTMLAGFAVIGALATDTNDLGSYEVYTLKNRRVNRNKVFTPMEKRLRDLGYIGESEPGNIYGGYENIPDVYFAAMNFFSQVMEIDYLDGVISREAQIALLGNEAKKSPVPSLDSEAQRLSSVSDSARHCPVYDYITLMDVQKTGNAYTLIGIFTDVSKSSRNVHIQYTKPTQLPDIYTGDSVVVIGNCIKYDSGNQCYIVDAQLIAFPADE